MNQQTNELDAAYAARATARANAETAAATLARAQRIKATADELVQQLEKSLETAEAEQAYRLEAQIAAGGPTDAFPPNLDAASIASELASARSSASISGKALASLKAADAQRQAELQAAEAAVVAVVDQLLDGEQLNLARQIQHHLNEAVRIGRPLFLEVLGFDLNTRRKPLAEVSAALARLDPLIDRMHIAINLTKTGDTKALAQRAARRAEMISGDRISPAADAAA